MVSSKEFADICKHGCEEWRQDIAEFQSVLCIIKERRRRLENDQKKNEETAERLRSARKSEKFMEDIIVSLHRGIHLMLDVAAIHNPDDPELRLRRRNRRSDACNGHSGHGSGHVMVGWFARWRRPCSRRRKKGYVLLTSDDDHDDDAKDENRSARASTSRSAPISCPTNEESAG